MVERAKMKGSVMNKAKTKKTALENAKEQLMNSDYGDDAAAILKPLTDSELKDLAAHYAEQWELASSNIGYSGISGGVFDLDRRT
jgi:hypothetical protein